MNLKKYLPSVIIPALVSGLMSVPLTFYYTIQYEKDRVIAEYKKEVFQGVVGYRYIFNQPSNPGSTVFAAAMNQVPFAFSDSNEVIDKFDDYYKVRSNDSFGLQANNDAFIALIYAMMDDLKIPKGTIGDKHLGRVFTIDNSQASN